MPSTPNVQNAYAQACLALVTDLNADLLSVPNINVIDSSTTGLTRKAATLAAEAASSFIAWATTEARDNKDGRPLLLWARFLPLCILARDYRDHHGTTSVASHMTKVIEQRCTLLRNHKFVGLYALLCDLRVIWYHRYDISPNAPTVATTEADDAIANLRRIMRNADKGITSIKDTLKPPRTASAGDTAGHFRAQLNDKGSTDAPRLCPTAADHSQIADPPTPPISLAAVLDTPEAYDEAKKLLTQLLRDLDPSKAAGPDRLNNTVPQYMLRLTHGPANLLDMLIAYDTFFAATDILPPCLQPFCHTVGLSFEKPNKPGKFRIIDIPTYFHSLYQRLLVKWHAATVSHNLLPYQLCLTPGGPDALVEFAQSAASHDPSATDRIQNAPGGPEMVTLMADVVQHYPDTDMGSTLQLIHESAPELTRLAHAAFQPHIIVCHDNDNKTTTLERRTNGLCQGSPASSALAGIKVAHLLRIATAGVQHNNNGNLPCQFLACHDNIVISCHVDLVPIVVEQLVAAAAADLYRLNDWALMLFGSTPQRDFIQQRLHHRIQSTPAANTGIQQLLQRLVTPYTNADAEVPGLLYRPDLYDILPPTVMGVPLFDPRHDATAFQRFAMDLISDHDAYYSTVTTLVNSAVGAAMGECRRLSPPDTAVQLAVAATKSLNLSSDHLLKSLPYIFDSADNELTKALWEALDTRLVHFLTRLLRLTEATPPTPAVIVDRVTQTLFRSPNAGGAGFIRLTTHRHAAVITSRQRTLPYFLAPKLPTAIAATAVNLSHACQQLVDRYDEVQDAVADIDANIRDALPVPHCAAPSTAPHDHVNAVSQYCTILLQFVHDDTVDTSNAPLPIPRRFLTQPISRLEALYEYYSATGHTAPGYWPPDWNQRRIESHLRSATSHNLSANASALWNFRIRHRNPVTRHVRIFTLSNASFHVATRLFFGIGIGGLTDPLPPQSQCQHNGCVKPMDAQGFHLLHSCYAIQAARSRRHQCVQRTVKELLHHTNLAVSDATPNVTTPNNNTNSFADVKISDPTAGASLIIDISLASPFTTNAYKAAPTTTAVQPGPPTVAHIAELRRKTKVQTKAPGCGTHPFLPFYLTATGAFTPHDLSTLPPYNHQLAKVFGTATQASLGGKVGTRPRSTEEALLRRWSRRAADFKKGGTGTFDITLPQSAAAAQILTHFYRKLAYDATRTTADGIVTAIQLNHRHFNVLIPLA